MYAPPSPQHHAANVDYFPSSAVEIVKLDITFDAGSCRQPQPCVAHAASQLMGEATATRNAAAVADFLDFRGIVVERSATTVSACMTFYFLRRYADELLPLIAEMVQEPLLTPQIFHAYCAKRRQQLQTNALKTSRVARNHFYAALFGSSHPLGIYAVADDVDRLTPDMIVAFWRQHYRLDRARILLSGAVDDALLHLVDTHLAAGVYIPSEVPAFPAPAASAVRHLSIPLTPTPPQSSIYVGRILPIPWHHKDYARFMVLNTLLGGYFGSRLMSNLREDKGYTYGIYSQTQIFLGYIVQYIFADVATTAVDDALRQVDEELLRLQQEPVGQDELVRVCTFMRGDYLRSVDGVFEIAERYRQMVDTAIDERLTENLLDALQSTTPAQLQHLAAAYLDPAQLLHVTAGADTAKC